MGLDRRGFISFLAGGTAGILCTPLVWKGLDDVSIWSQNWPWIPRLKYGAREKVPSLCKLGSDVYGISVLKVGGNPVSAYGSEDHVLSLGGIDALGAASVQMLYSPSRVRTPLKRVGEKLVPVSWDEAKGILVEQLQLAGKNVALISGDETGSSTEVLAAFVASLGSEDSFFMPGEWGPANVVWNDVLGGKGLVGYDLENADCVVALGADLFSSWGTTLRNTRLLAGEGKQANFIFAGPVQNNTASLCDWWIPCLPGSLGRLALGVAWHLLQEISQPRLGVDGFDNYRDFIQKNFQPEQVAADTGVSIKDIARLAKTLLAAKRPLVLPGTESGMGMNPFDLAATLSLNILLGQVNVPGGIMCLPEPENLLEKAPARAMLRKKDLLSFLRRKGQKSGESGGVTLVYEANPVYALPDCKQSIAALENTFLVSFSSFLDETAAKAELVLPNSYFLERLDDAYSPYGSGKANYSLGQPVLEPLFDTRSTPDFIFDLASQMDIDLGFASYEEMLQARTVALEANWDSLLEGESWLSDALVPCESLSLWHSVFDSFKKRPLEPKELLLSASWLPLAGNTQMAMTPFSLPGISDTNLKGNDLFVHINSITARKQGLLQGQRVRISGLSGESCKVRVHISEEVMPGVAWAPLGFGRSAWDEFSRGKGENILRLLGAEADEYLGLSVFLSPSVYLEKAM